MVFVGEPSKYECEAWLGCLLCSQNSASSFHRIIMGGFAVDRRKCRNLRQPFNSFIASDISREQGPAFAHATRSLLLSHFIAQHPLSSTCFLLSDLHSCRCNTINFQLDPPLPPAKSNVAQYPLYLLLNLSNLDLPHPPLAASYFDHFLCSIAQLRSFPLRILPFSISSARS
jgi:hypothetical protein